METEVLEPEVIRSESRVLSTPDLTSICKKRILTGVRVPEWPPGVDRMYLVLGGTRVLAFLRDDWVDLKDLVVGGGGGEFPGIPLGKMQYQTITFQVEPRDLVIEREEVEVRDDDENYDEERDFLTNDGRADRIMHGRLLPRRMIHATYQGTMPGLVLEFLPDVTTAAPQTLWSPPDPVDIHVLQRVRLPAEKLGVSKFIQRVVPGTECDGFVEAYFRNKLRFMHNMVGTAYCFESGVKLV